MVISYIYSKALNWNVEVSEAQFKSVVALFSPFVRTDTFLRTRDKLVTVDKYYY